MTCPPARCRRSPARRLALAFLLAILPPAALADAQAPLALAEINQDAAAEKTVVVRLADGSRIRGRLIEETEASYILEADQLGRIEIPRENVVELLDPSVALGPKESQEPPPPPGLLGTGLLAGWDKSLALGFTGKSAGNDSVDVYGKLSGDYADEERRWRIRASYFYGTVESENSKNEGFTNGRRDWLFPDEPLFLWAEARADYNEFKDYHLRLGGFAGVGYAFMDRPELKVLGRVGAGGSHEFGAVDGTIPEALVALEADWKLTDRQSLSFVNTFFPDLDEFGRYRNFSEAAYNIRVDTGRGLSLKFGVQNEYDSFTEDDAPHNALTYFGALVLDF